MNVNLRTRLLLPAALIVALAGCVTSSPAPSAPVAETGAGTPADTARVVEETVRPETPASQPTAPRAEAPVAATAASSDAPASAPPTTDPSVVALLQEELWVTGPPLFSLLFCTEAPPGAEMPAASWEATLDSGHVCLWGFPAGDEIAYEITDAAGDPVDAGTTQAMESLDGPPVAEVVVEISDRTSGEWTVRAASRSVQLDTTIAAEITPAPRLRAVPGPKVAEGHTQEALAAGDQVTVIASGMPANDTLALGVYKTEEGPDRTTHFQRVLGGAVPTDGSGKFESVLTIDPSDPPGGYCVVVPLTTEYVPRTEVTADGATVCFAVAE